MLRFDFKNRINSSYNTWIDQQIDKKISYLKSSETPSIQHRPGDERLSYVYWAETKLAATYLTTIVRWKYLVVARWVIRS